MAKKKEPIEEAANAILQRNNKDALKWKKEQLETAQVKFLRGEDPDLEKFVLNRARQELILKEIKKLK